MEQWNFRDGIIPFLVAVAMYGFYLFQPRLGQKWKEAQRKLAEWREYEVRIETPDEASRVLLKQKTFDPEFNTLGSLGFEYLGDYVVRTGVQIRQFSSSAPLASPDVTGAKQFRILNLAASRVFVHEEHGCVAFIMAISSRGVHPLVQIVSQGEGWIYTSEASDPLIDDVGRSPQHLKSYHGAVSPRQLLAAHLAHREQIARAGGFSWGAPATMQEIFDEEQSYATGVREFARHHSPLSYLIWEYQERRRGSAHWLGELTGRLSLPKPSIHQ